METEELTKLVDGIYKNILEKFNPGARQMIMAGKAYLKALHAAATASKVYVDTIGKLGRQAQQGTWGGSADIGTALMKVVEVHREIHGQNINTLKAFYVDFLVPLETNLEKDTKVIQSEQKRFLHQHKMRSESYNKAAVTIKKYQRKGTKNSIKTGTAIEKEIKIQQTLEEEKRKLDNFCEQSLKNAMIQERRRYGFLLERQCSLAKHFLAYHAIGSKAFAVELDSWKETATMRESLPNNVESMFHRRIKHVQMWQDDDVYSSPATGECELRKSKSMEAAYLEDGNACEELNQMTLSRAKSDADLRMPTPNAYYHEKMNQLIQKNPKMSSAPFANSWEPALARALFAYYSSAQNQLSMIEGDIIALLGERTKGWQFGENLRTRETGWFPLAYTEIILDDSPTCMGQWSTSASVVSTPSEPLPPAPLKKTQLVHPPEKLPPTRMFGDTIIIAHRSSKHRFGVDPPPAPAPSAPSSTPSKALRATSAQSTLPQKGDVAENNIDSAHATLTRPTKCTPPSTNSGVVAPVSLHSSNDSGFANEPPPQPDVDYSDEDSHRRPTFTKNASGLINKENRDYLAKTQSLKRSPTWTQVEKSLNEFNLHAPNFLSDKESVRVKRTKSFWKFGRNVSQDIMTGMSLWKHKDLIDDKQENEQQEELMVALKLPASATIDRKEILRLKPVTSDRSQNLNPSQMMCPNNHAQELDSVKEGTLHRPRPDSRQSDATEASTIKTNFENSYYDDEGGFMVRTVKRRDILRRYDGSDDSGNDPYDSIVVADHAEPEFCNENGVEINKTDEESNTNEKQRSFPHNHRESCHFEVREQKISAFARRDRDFENDEVKFEVKNRKPKTKEAGFEKREQEAFQSKDIQREIRSSRSTEKREILPYDKSSQLLGKSLPKFYTCENEITKNNPRGYTSESDTLKREKSFKAIERYESNYPDEIALNSKREHTIEPRERNIRETPKRERSSRYSEERRASNISDLDESSTYEYETDSRKAARKGNCPLVEDAPQLLPRTRLIRQPAVTTFGPWYDLWPTNENAQ